MFRFENQPSTWRGLIWVFTGLLALIFRQDPTIVAEILSGGAAIAGGIGLATRDPKGMDEQAMATMTALANAVRSQRPTIDSPPPPQVARGAYALSAHELALVELLRAFEDLRDIRPYLALEIGYNTATDWCVHIYDAQGTGLQNAPKIVEEQDPYSMIAFGHATDKLRALIAQHRGEASA
jgi:hypothetical protein